MGSQLIFPNQPIPNYSLLNNVVIIERMSVKFEMFGKNINPNFQLQQDHGLFYVVRISYFH